MVRQLGHCIDEKIQVLLRGDPAQKTHPQIPPLAARAQGGNLALGIDQGVMQCSLPHRGREGVPGLQVRRKHE